MNRELVILGAGESGTGAALLAHAHGLLVFVSDNHPIRDEYKEQLIEAGVCFEEGEHSLARILKANEVVKSPGIPDSSELIKKIKAKGIPIISEIELAGRYTNAFTIGITGSNGKTTTAMWTNHILQLAGLKVALAGNIGQSFARRLLDPQPDFFVLELSSFQLDGMFDFKCNTSVITNITPDHLDRYDNNFANYVAAKFRITQNQGSKEVLVFGGDDEVVTGRLRQLDGSVAKWSFSQSHSCNPGAYVDGDQLVFHRDQTLFSLPVAQVSLPGKHNLYNAMAAGLAALSAGVSPQWIVEGLSSFSAVEHRMEQVDEVKEVLFINDSKATNVDSAWYALDSMTRPVVWIAGGTDKGNDYNAVASLVQEKVKVLICLGVNNEKLISFFKDKVPQLVEARSMQEAIQKASVMAHPGDVVLLSPACASFDLFNNYEHRGELFKEEVKNLLINEE